MMCNCDKAEHAMAEGSTMRFLGCRWMVGLCLGIAALTTGAHAQSLSDSCAGHLSAQPISIVVPNQAGGGYDTYARAFAPALRDLFDGRVGVINMPGGGGRLALVSVATQDDSELRIVIESFSDLISAADGDASLNLSSADFAPLGIILTEAASLVCPR